MSPQEKNKTSTHGQLERHCRQAINLFFFDVALRERESWIAGPLQNFLIVEKSKNHGKMLLRSPSLDVVFISQIQN